MLPVGTVVTLGQLRGLVQGAALAFPPAAACPGVPGAARDQAGRAGPGASTDALGGNGTAGGPAAGDPLPLPELTQDCARRFEEAAGLRDAVSMAAVILDLEEAVHAWAADTDEDQGTGQARVVLRGLITRLGALARDGLREPGVLPGAAVEPLLNLRNALRAEGRYADADTIRDALTAAGLVIQDTPAGPQWQPGGRR